MKKFLNFAVVATVTAVSLTACGVENDEEPAISNETSQIITDTQESDNIMYADSSNDPLTVSTSYGFNLKLPSGWDEKCDVVPLESSGSIALYTKSIKDAEGPDGYQGWLGTFEKVSDDLLTYEEFTERSEELTGGLGFRYMYSDENGTFGIRYPSELQWNPDVESQIDEWVDMFAQMNDIIIVNDANETISVEPSADDIEYINRSVSDIRTYNTESEPEPDSEESLESAETNMEISSNENLVETSEE